MSDENNVVFFLKKLEKEMRNSLSEWELKMQRVDLHRKDINVIQSLYGNQTAYMRIWWIHQNRRSTRMCFLTELFNLYSGTLLRWQVTYENLLSLDINLTTYVTQMVLCWWQIQKGIWNKSRNNARCTVVSKR